MQAAALESLGLLPCIKVVGKQIEYHCINIMKKLNLLVAVTALGSQLKAQTPYKERAEEMFSCVGPLSGTAIWTLSEYYPSEHKPNLTYLMTQTSRLRRSLIYGR